MTNKNNSNLNKVPDVQILMHYVFDALLKLGGSGTNKEIDNKVVELMDLPADVVNYSHLGSYTQTELSYRIAWAKTKLKKQGIITNSQRSVWSICQQYVTYSTLEEIPKESEKINEENTREAEEEIETAQNWIDKVSTKLHTMDPYAFERLTQRLLRE